MDPLQLFLVHIRLPLHSLSKVQSPALTSQGFSAVHLFKTFRTSEISRKNSRIRVKCKVHCNASSLCLTSALSVEARFFCRLLEKTKLVLSSKSLINLNLPPFPPNLVICSGPSKSQCISTNKWQSNIVYL